MRAKKKKKNNAKKELRGRAILGIKDKQEMRERMKMNNTRGK